MGQLTNFGGFLQQLPDQQNGQFQQNSFSSSSSSSQKSSSQSSQSFNQITQVSGGGQGNFNALDSFSNQNEDFTFNNQNQNQNSFVNAQTVAPESFSGGFEEDFTNNNIPDTAAQEQSESLGKQIAQTVI